MPSQESNISKLILASASPRRRELIAMLKVPFTIESPDIDESIQPKEAPVNFVKRLSQEKAAAIAKNHESGLIVAADTIVVYLGEILGKPKDAADARQMLQKLRGKKHRVMTGVTVHDAATGKAITDLCDSQVYLREMSDEEIENYIATGDPMDKAAAYAIQNVEYAPVEQVIGCPANVMGLPMCHVIRSLYRQGMELPESKPRQCKQQFGGYYCAIAEEVMPGLTEQGMIP